MQWVDTRARGREVRLCHPCTADRYIESQCKIAEDSRISANWKSSCKKLLWQFLKGRTVMDVCTQLVTFKSL